MNSESPPEPAAEIGIPAATVIVFRRAPAGGAPEIMMLERAAHMRFAAGASVFPGGRVDPADHILAARTAPQLDPADAAARIAAIRETLEETGLLLGVRQSVTVAEVEAARALVSESGSLEQVLERFGWSLELDALVPFARWCPDFARAFDTRFYLADLGTGNVAVAEDGTETARLYWSPAGETLRLARQGQVSAIFPTLCNLERLALFASFTEAAEQARRIPLQVIRPWTETIDGVRHLTIPDDAGYPVTQVRADSVKRS